MTVSGYNTGLARELQVRSLIPKSPTSKSFGYFNACRQFLAPCFFFHTCRPAYTPSGRGVLVDYASYAAKRGITYTTFSRHQIRLTDILEIAKESNLTFHRGDILFVRIGVTNEWDNIMT